MNTVASTRRKIPLPALITTVVVGLVLAAGAAYFLRSSPTGVARSQTAEEASADAKAYVRELQLSEVSMQATENFMNQQVVEVQGKIANNGSRSLDSVDVFCLFTSVDGHVIGRERLPILRAKGAPLKPGEVRTFRLPFDSTPDGWNQAMPRMVIAQISFTP